MAMRQAAFSAFAEGQMPLADPRRKIVFFFLIGPDAIFQKHALLFSQAHILQ
jgi:hypothetical protein